jgi:transcriptional regulator with XRE-family HTH domain
VGHTLVMVNDKPSAQAETLGRRIRRLRTVKGWSQEKLAVFAGLTRATVNDAENDKGSRRETIEAIAGALGTTSLYLIAGYDRSVEGWKNPKIALRATTSLTEEQIDALAAQIEGLEILNTREESD